MQQSPQLAPILNVYPAGQLAVDANTDEFTHQGAIDLSENSGFFRFDHRVTDRTFLSVRLAIDDSFTSAPLGNLLDKQQIINRPQNYLIALDHIFSPAIFNACRTVPVSPRGELELSTAVKKLVQQGARLKVLCCRGGVLDLSQRADIPQVVSRLASIRVSL